MATVWLSYAWADNQHQDVDFIAQELGRAGVTVRLDRWNIVAGTRLWEQIEGFISRPSESDAWVLLATQNSLTSEACKEEYAYALERALNARNENFPVIALFLTHIDPFLVPAGIRTRLHVSVTDPDWKERIVAAAEGRAHSANRVEVKPYYLQLHSQQLGDYPFAVEVRPRAGVWAPFVAAVPMAEKEAVQPFIMIGPRNVPTINGLLVNSGEMETADTHDWLMIADNQSTPTQSYYIWCKCIPSCLTFGENNSAHQFTVQLNQSGAI